jgi:hypothetical protein
MAQLACSADRIRCWSRTVAHSWELMDSISVDLHSHADVSALTDRGFRRPILPNMSVRMLLRPHSAPLLFCDPLPFGGRLLLPVGSA